MKVGISCLFAALDLQGGLQIRLKALISGLCERGHCVTLIQSPYAHRLSREFFSTLGGHDLKAVTIGNHRSGDVYLGDILRASYYDAFDAIGKEIDVLDSYDSYLRIPSRRPALVHSSNYYIEYITKHLRYAGWDYLAFPVLNILLRQVIVRAADMLIVENSLQAKSLIRYSGLPSEKISVILPGYDQNIVRDLLAEQEQQRETPRVVFSGRLTHLKGVLELVRAFRAVHHDFPEWQLLIVGDGHLRSTVESMIAEMKLTGVARIVGFVPYRENLRYIMSSDIFVLPSYIEGVPLALIEAMALGKTVIATDVGAISTHLIENNKSGILVEPMEVESIRTALESVMGNEDLRAQLSEEARKRASCLTYDRMVNMTVDTYAKAIKANGGK